MPSRPPQGSGAASARSEGTADKVVIAGAGQAGASAAIALRKGGFCGKVIVYGDEPHVPYERPPLSKDFLLGERPVDRLFIRPHAFWSEREIDFRLGKRVSSVNPDRKAVILDDGSTCDFDHLIWAGGGQARTLSCAGSHLDGVHTLRTIGDSQRLREDLMSVGVVVVVGAGFVGLEVAAVLSKLGKKVIVVEAADRVMARVAGHITSGWFLDLHRGHGIDVRLGTGLDAIIGDNGRVSSVLLADGEVLACDLVIAGIGLIPSAIPVEGRPSGQHGELVDAHCRTEFADIYAIGDCAVHVSKFAAGAATRIESVQNASDQAAVAAANIVGRRIDYSSVPWFWSHQHDAKFQSVGLSVGADREIVLGSRQSGKFGVAYLRQRTLAAVDSVNAPGIFARAKKLILQEFANDGEVVAALS